ncbi:Gfo/Idh/MocA family protein [Jeotgalibacillus proteolyticus]|uniref:Gfo/Idh/MocA family oxidoreductase n=1 Tax=Jeotgalibacillus proteolyticus TaxID=2082395 RepID=A0A2S5G7K1_9BACL|nr:Gfo/Idh/MocA family oxidoreductase [Jeotgalibacillus proteolyticus]PPA68959.1 hypothetical protein C4B60_18795 [Jeotgalibacillus proteolyticus]
MKPLKVIQIGAGGFGQSWLTIVEQYERTELVGVVDLVPENLSKAKEEINLPADRFYSNVDLVLKELEADAALIITPPKTHKDLAIKALQAGLHVLMEKPLAHSIEEAHELMQISAAFNKKIAISQNYRWRAPIRTAKELLQKEMIGEIGYIEYEFRKAIKFGGWRDQYSEILLEDMSIHHFDIVRYLLGKEPLEVYAQSFRPKWSWFAGNPSASVAIQFEDNIRVSYFGSWVSRGRDTSWNGDIRIAGEHGAIEIIDDEVRLYLVENEEVKSEKVELMPVSYSDQMGSLDDFAQAIEKNTIPATSLEDNIKSFQLTCAAIKSAQEEKKVTIFSQGEMIEDAK